MIILAPPKPLAALTRRIKTLNRNFCSGTGIDHLKHLTENKMWLQLGRMKFKEKKLYPFLGKHKLKPECRC